MTLEEKLRTCEEVDSIDETIDYRINCGRNLYFVFCLLKRILNHNSVSFPVKCPHCKHELEETFCFKPDGDIRINCRCSVCNVVEISWSFEELKNNGLIYEPSDVEKMAAEVELPALFNGTDEHWTADDL